MIGAAKLLRLDPLRHTPTQPLNTLGVVKVGSIIAPDERLGNEPVVSGRAQGFLCRLKLKRGSRRPSPK
jgi:hypothetical protein